MSELALSMGREGHLIGVMTPAEGKPQPVALLLLNAGVIHHVGPHRLHVKLARHMARLGFTSLRFDISGVGDSRVPQDAAPLVEQAVLDLRTAMDYLEHTHGFRRFAVFGICAGAMNAYATAQVDERICAMFMVDGYIYPTLKSLLVRLYLRVMWLGPAQSIKRISAVAVGALRRLWRKPQAEAAVAESSAHPTRQQFAQTMQMLVDRGVHPAVLFSGSRFAHYSYRNQFRDTFAGHAFVDRVICHYEPDIDHTVTPLAAQARLACLVESWLRSVPLAAPARI